MPCTELNVGQGSVLKSLVLAAGSSLGTGVRSSARRGSCSLPQGSRVLLALSPSLPSPGARAPAPVPGSCAGTGLPPAPAALPAWPSPPGPTPGARAWRWPSRWGRAMPPLRSRAQTGIPLSPGPCVSPSRPPPPGPCVSPSRPPPRVPACPRPAPPPGPCVSPRRLGRRVFTPVFVFPPLFVTEYFEYKIKPLGSARVAGPGGGGPVAGAGARWLGPAAGGWAQWRGRGPGGRGRAPPRPHARSRRPHWSPQSHAGRRRGRPFPPSLRASLRRAERWERPRSQHEHPQGLQHLGDRIPGDQIPTERSNQNPRWEKHQVRAGGHLPGQRSAGGDEGEGRQPQSHPTPDRQRRPLLRGLRALCGSGGAKHPAGVPEAGLSPGSPPVLDSTCIPEHPHLRPPSLPGCQRCPGTTTCIPA